VVIPDSQDDSQGEGFWRTMLGDGGFVSVASHLDRTVMDRCRRLARGLQNRGRSSTDVRPRSLLSTNVHCIDRMTANDSRVGRSGLSYKKAWSEPAKTVGNPPAVF
jgi:hypothetical protein